MSRRFWTFVTLSAAVVILWGGAASAQESKRSLLKIPEPEFDFGAVAQGSVVKHDFVIKNLGNADLSIQKLVPSCGCTASKTTSDIVAANGQELIHVEFDTSGFSGEKYKTVRVYTSDLDQPTALLTLKGYIEPDITVEPKQLFFGEVVKGRDAGIRKEVKISLKDAANVHLSGVKSFSNYVAVEELAPSASGEKRFAVSLTENIPLGDLRDRVVVGLVGGKTASINIPIFASVKGSLKLSPQVLSFGILEGKAPVRRVVKFDNFSDKPVKITGAVSDHRAVKVAVKQVLEGKNYVIEVTVDPTLVDGDLRTSVRLETDDTVEQSLSLSVFGVTPPVGATGKN